ncbi:NAD-dependent deacylase [Fibrobacter sp.]|uniref:NAD-dependent deacylase n=1 Tax=Fibrobacter sp. TaxID=35828 RepID=UPI00388D0E90
MKKRLVVLTGAGISAESGLRTFRGNDGMWEHENIEDVCTPDALRRDPKRVKDFYNFLRKGLPNHQPNAAHLALAELEERLGDEFLLVTQNVDDLHERAGSKRVLHMHGDLMKLRCTGGGEHEFPFTGEETLETKCPVCGAKTRPDIVFFGEVPLYMDQIQDALRECDEFVYIGTSSVVYPAAGFKSFAKSFGAKVTCLNLEIPDHDPYTDVFVQGKATEVVPKWTKEFK